MLSLQRHENNTHHQNIINPRERYQWKLYRERVMEELRKNILTFSGYSRTKLGQLRGHNTKFGHPKIGDTYKIKGDSGRHWHCENNMNFKQRCMLATVNNMSVRSGIIKFCPPQAPLRVSGNTVDSVETSQKRQWRLYQMLKKFEYICVF